MRKIASLLFGLSLVSLVAPAQAQFLSGRQANRWGPNGNGTLDHEDDLRWVFFHDTRIKADNAKGVYIATFAPNLAKMNGKDFTITGYMLPVEASTRSPHFVLTRRSSGCPFCPPNEPTEAIEVTAQKAVQYTQSPVTIRGRLHLVRSSGTGLFFRLDQARVLS